jgi:pimeloyl-ACP methyl ester carboxylesterase
MRGVSGKALFSLVVAVVIGCGNDIQSPLAREWPEWLELCEVSGFSGARCGDFSVFEDRAAQAGRRIDIAVVILPAAATEPEPDPVLFITGGPGQAATTLISFANAAYAELRQRRDLVFIDQRGTGASNLLACPGPFPSGDASVLGTLFPPDHIAACRERLSERADLGLYASHLAVDDMAEVLTALEYERVNLVGTSFGTRVVQVFLRRHPDRVRTAVMNGVVPVSRNVYAHSAANAQTALDLLMDECGADVNCADRYPDVRSRFWDLVGRFDAGPIQVRRPRGTVAFDRGDFGYAVRGMLYGELADEVLAWTWDTYLTGDFTRFADYAIERAAWIASPSFGTGMHLSVICSEDMPFGAGDVEALSADTFLGLHLYERYNAACQRWVRGPIAPGFHEPVTSDAPVLVISGEHDPVTPAAWGEEVAAHLSGSHHIIIPSGGHGITGPCTLGMQLQLITEGSVEGLDSSCPVGG